VFVSGVQHHFSAMLVQGHSQSTGVLKYPAESGRLEEVISPPRGRGGDTLNVQNGSGGRRAGQVRHRPGGEPMGDNGLAGACT
jgi:hypothetical protein